MKSSRGFQDRTILTVSKPIKDYDIPENLVLKKTISLIYDLMTDEDVKKEIEREYSWSKEIRESRGYIRNVLKNVHFKKIVDANEIRITSRMKSQVVRKLKKYDIRLSH